MALEFYDLVKLDPSFATAPFYFSGENGLCLLRDDRPWNSAPPPPSFGDKSHPWNGFREQVTTLAADPIFFRAHLEKQLSDLLDMRQARKLACAIVVFPSVKEVILMRRVNFEERVAKMVGYLEGAVGAGREFSCPGMSSWSLPHITYLDYDYNKGENAWLAMRKAILAHTV